MRTVLSRSAHADQLEAEVRDATCCVAADRCSACTVKLGEVRAARRDAILLTISTVRPRRAGW
jgi:type 1 fimbria pilin